MPEDDEETWLLKEGHHVIERKSVDGYAALNARDRLIYCVWAADYGMRNAGDLATAANLHPTFLRDGHSAAQALGLPRCTDAFSLSCKDLEDRYFALFDGIVAELRAA